MIMSHIRRGLEHILAVVAIWLLLVAVLSTLFQSSPATMHWLSDHTWATALVLAVFIYLISLSADASNRKSVIAKVLAVVLLAVFLLWVVMSALDLPKSTTEAAITLDPTVQFLKRQEEMSVFSATLGLNETQREEVESLINERGFITREELGQLGLTQSQIAMLIDMLRNLGYITYDDAMHMFEEQSTAVASVQTATAIAMNATATAQAPICYVTPSKGISDVNVRSSPNDSPESDNRVGSLYSTQSLRVVARNGGTINQDLWWVVEYPIGTKLIDGWVLSSVVDESNIEACLALPQARGT